MMKTDTSPRNPPHHHRFKKGQSGNPRGRPPKKLINETEELELLQIDQAILSASRQELTFKNGDSNQSMTGQEAIIRAQTKTALAGNAHAQKDILNRIERAEIKSRAVIKKDIQDRKNQFVFWKKYKAHWGKKFEDAKANEIPMPDCPVHPDDVLIKDNEEFDIVGPWNDHQQKVCQENLSFREALLLQHALDLKISQHPTLVAGYDSIYDNDGALLLAKIIDQQLPPRLQLSANEWFTKLSRNQARTKRDLLKAVPAQWKHLKRDGHPAAIK